MTFLVDKYKIPCKNQRYRISYFLFPRAKQLLWITPPPPKPTRGTPINFGWAKWRQILWSCVHGLFFFLFCWLDIIELLQQNLNSFFTVWVGNLKQSLADTVRNICFRKRYNVLCWFSLKFMNLFQDPQFSQKVFFFQLKEKLRKNTPPSPIPFTPHTPFLIS